MSSSGELPEDSIKIKDVYDYKRISSDDKNFSRCLIFIGGRFAKHLKILNDYNAALELLDKGQMMFDPKWVHAPQNMLTSMLGCLPARLMLSNPTQKDKQYVRSIYKKLYPNHPEIINLFDLKRIKRQGEYRLVILFDNTILGMTPPGMTLK